MTLKIPHFIFSFIPCVRLTMEMSRVPHPESGVRTTSEESVKCSEARGPAPAPGGSRVISEKIWSHKLTAFSQWDVIWKMQSSPARPPTSAGPPRHNKQGRWASESGQMSILDFNNFSSDIWCDIIISTIIPILPYNFILNSSFCFSSVLQSRTLLLLSSIAMTWYLLQKSPLSSQLYNYIG